MDAVLGVRPMTCPWRAREHPLVRDVLHLYGAREMTDPLVAAGGDHAPNELVEALLRFDSDVGAIRAHERELQRERDRARQSAPAKTQWTARKR
jgi:hypothetical protein